jgi:hypothetical protein
MEEWRRGILVRLDVTLVLFDLLLSAIFIVLGYLTGNPYLRGVGVGLAIAGVTGGVAYIVKTRMATP